MEERIVSRFTATQIRPKITGSPKFLSDKETSARSSSYSREEKQFFADKSKICNIQECKSNDEKFFSEDSVEQMLKKMQNKVRSYIQFSESLKNHENMMNQVIHNAFRHRQAFHQILYLRNLKMEQSCKNMNQSKVEEYEKQFNSLKHQAYSHL